MKNNKMNAALLNWVYAVLLMGYLMSCNGTYKDEVREFIPGSYTRSIDNEFSKGSDLLIVQQKEGNTYTIEKRSQVVRIRNGKPLPIKYDTVTWTGIYDPNDKVIYEQQKGKVISFVPEENKLLVGGSAYQKVNQ